MNLFRKSSHTRLHKRQRRGVSLFAVVIGLLVGIVMLDFVVQELGRAQKRAAGRHFAEVASIMAQRWELLVRDCAIDPTSCGVAEVTAQVWAGYNTLPSIASLEIDPIPAALRVHSMQPVSWVGDAPVSLANGITVRAFVISVSQAPIATGMLVFEVAPNMDVLTRESFRAALADWGIGVGEGEEIVGVEQPFENAIGRSAFETEVPVLTYPFATVESEWVLREPWVGQSGQAMRSQLRMGDDGTTTGSIVNAGGLEALDAAGLTVQSAALQSMVATDEVVTQTLATVDLASAQLNATNLIVSDNLNAGTMAVASALNTQNITINDSDIGINFLVSEVANAGTLKGSILTLPGQLQAGTISVADRLQSDVITTNSHLFVGGDILGNFFRINDITTLNGCTGC